ncbi:Glycosyltransferase Family 4 [Lutibacter oricola]|uniref:Glycosyltransferase Family 4 n=1 Tax=Lutibacter oricola TaxID=762486 RepID=A0A1H2WZU6_9FLAO|nr:glycosyltransferase [Lutibacter oricola]SDW86081.1 Glycosyltransferase Family 4 [Lutibacter oricola]
MPIKNILIVIESLDPNHSSGIKGRLALIKNLSEIGYKLKIYHYSQKEILLPNIECIAIKEQKISVYYLLSRLQRVFTRVTKININPFIESIFGFSFTFFNDVKSLKKTLKKERDFNPDWVLTLSYASSFRPHKALLGIPNWHSKWLAYVHDPYPMHSYPRPYDWVEPGHKFKRNLFLKIVDRAKYIIYPSQLLAEWMRSYYPNQNRKEVIIPHQISSVQSNNSIKLPTFFDEKKFNILHAGSMMSARKPYGLIEGFEKFIKKNPVAKEDARLLFIGKISCFDDYIKNKQKELKQLITNDYLPFSQVKKMQEKTSVNIVLEAKGAFSPFLPGKIPHIIEANKPILLLGPLYSESKRILGESFNNWAEIDDVKSVERIITEMYFNWKNKIENNNYSKVKYYLSKDYLKEQFNNLKE